MRSLVFELSNKDDHDEHDEKEMQNKSCVGARVARYSATHIYIYIYKRTVEIETCLADQPDIWFVRSVVLLLLLLILLKYI